MIFSSLPIHTSLAPSVLLTRLTTPHLFHSIQEASEMQQPVQQFTEQGKKYQLHILGRRSAHKFLLGVEKCF